MPITDVRVRRDRTPLLSPYTTAERTLTAVESVYVQVVDETGLVGWGEAVPNLKVTGDSWAGLEPLLLGPLRACCIGRDPADYEDICREIEYAVVGNPAARAALDVAVHDLWARQLGIPLRALFGGGADRVPTAVSVPVDTVDAMVERAVAFHDQGFGIVKVKVGRPGWQDVEAVREIDRALPAGVRIWVDANQGWPAKHAIRVLDALERADVDVELVEQPVPAGDLDGLRLVTHAVHAQVIADESVLSPLDALRLIRHEAADGFVIKLNKCGGLRPARRLLALAESAGKSCLVSTTTESVLGVTAAATLAVIAPHVVRYADLDAVLWSGTQPLTGGIRYDKGDAVLPAEPGLGVSG